MDRPETTRIADIQHIRTPKVREKFAISEDDLLHVLRKVWPNFIPDIAQVHPVEETGDDESNPAVVTVSWYREPEPGEYETLKKDEADEEEEADEYDPDEDDDFGEDMDDDEEEYDSPNAPRCTGCGREINERHTTSCPRGSYKKERVVGTDCKTQPAHGKRKRGPGGRK